ncbi:MAG: trans-sulfuration enzyme family protein [Bacteroidota bacterium]
MRTDTLVVRENGEHRSTAPHVLPIYATSSFVFEDAGQSIEIFKNIESGHVYSRYANPTVDAVADKIALLESYGSDRIPYAVMTSSGMAAISTLLMGVLKSGDKVLTQGDLYGGTTELLKSVLGNFGVETIFTDMKDLAGTELLLRTEENIRLIYCETPSNPTLACYDIASIAALAHQYGALCAVDNTFATPMLQRPLLLGADFVIHSTTKYLNGHGNSIAGVVVGYDRDLMRGGVWKAMKLAGTNCSPFEAWLTSNGMKTLALRMERHCSNAMKMAAFLSEHPAVERVNYPGLPTHPDHELAKKQMNGGFGGMLSFELKSGMEGALKCMDSLKLCTQAPTLGDVDTLILHPASSSHLAVPRETRIENGITDGLIRVSVGIENPDDLIADLDQAIRK